MITKEEYKRAYIRMMDSVRDKDSMYKNQACCDGVDCYDCILHDSDGCICDCEGVHTYEIIERVEKWSKEHPIQSNLDKFKEVFCLNGVSTFDMPCPMNIGLVDEDYCDGKGCGVCKKEFWNSEYKAPTKEVKDGDSN